MPDLPTHPLSKEKTMTATRAVKRSMMHRLLDAFLRRGPGYGLGNPVADALAAELHRRCIRLDELRNDPDRSEAAERKRMQVHGETIGLRGALGIVLGGTVPGGEADRLGMEYHLAWMKGEESQ
ncbi:hypothetical protein [Streptomyces sp. AD55]|uniref:hypothetical protein n=1 Tax=Streptomyces sp. AD55 TaxID=3242895 RepID=UPI003529354E